MPEKRDNRGLITKARDTYESATEKLTDARDKTREKIQENLIGNVRQILRALFS